MKIHSKTIDILTRTIRTGAALVLCLCCCMVAMAQNRGEIDPTELDFGTNLAVPEVPEKQTVAIKTHMYKIGEALQHNGFSTTFGRNGEVVSVTIPCSELFAPNDTLIKDSGHKKLQRLSRLLQYPTMYKVVVAVYSDDTGESMYCDYLTSVRANAVESALSHLAESEGVWHPNIIPYGMGQSDPRVENNTIDNRALNRRVEIYFIPEWEMIKTAKSGKLN